MTAVPRAAAITATLAITLLLAACGKDDETTMTEATTETVTVTDTTSTETTTGVKPVDCQVPPPQGGGQYDVFATDIDCGTAKSVVQRWVAGCISAPDGVACQVGIGFECVYTQTGDEVGDVACTRPDDGAWVTFVTGA